MKEPIKASPNADEQLKVPQDGPQADTTKTDQKFGATEDDPKPSDAVPVPLEEAIDRGFDAWLAARLSNSVLSRNTEAWNLLRKEKATLKDFIMKEVQ